MKLYRVLGDIAFEAGRDADGKIVHGTATKGAIVQLHDKDAAALVARGDVVFHADEPVALELTFQLPPIPAIPPKVGG